MSSARRLAGQADLAELRAFSAAADLGTLGRAAVALGISSPALSKRLRRLEAAAGTDLLSRSPTGVELTAAGRHLYPEVRRLLDQAEIVDGMLARAAGDGVAPMRFAVSHTIAEFHLPHELVAYQANGARRPPVELTIANSSTVQRLVAAGQVSAGITAIFPDDAAGGELELHPLLDDEVVIAVPRSHPWYRRKTIPQRSLLRTALVMRDPEAHDRRCVERVLGEHGLPMLEPLIEVGSTAVAKREALELSAPVLLSRLSIDEGRDRLYVRPAAELSFPRSFAIVSRSLASLPRAERDFIDFLLRDRTGVGG